VSSNPQNPIPPAAAPVGDRPHAPPADDEAVYYHGSPFLGGKPEEVLAFGLVGTLFLLGPIIYKLTAHGWPAQWATLAMLIVGVVLWIIPVVITKSTRYRISNYRIDYERGLIARDISTLELWHVEDIAFHQSFLDRLLGIGTIRVISHDESMPNLYMRGIPDARKLFIELEQRIISVKRQTGVLKLDTGS